MLKISPLTFLFLAAMPLHAEPKVIPQSFHKNGTVKESLEAGPPLDGKYRGILKEFYESGGLKREMPIINAGGELGFEPDGVVKDYFANGKSKASVGFKSGKRHGPFTYFHEDGSLRESGVFGNDTSKPDQRLARSGGKIGLAACLFVEAGKTEVEAPEDIVVHVDNFHDEGAHLGWVFGYQQVGSGWKRMFQEGRGDHLESRGTKTITIRSKDLSPGTWRIGVTYMVKGPDHFTEVMSKTILIGPAPPVPPRPARPD